MQTIINIYEAKTKLSQLVSSAMDGHEVIIAKAGKPMVTLKPIEDQKVNRVSGQLKGEVWMAKNFDDLPNWFTKNFS